MLKKRTLNKLLIDSCTKTPFSFNVLLYQQIDGVSTVNPLGPTLADIIMTELENIVIQPLLTSGTLKFYARYVDDTLVLSKPSDIPLILLKLNSFDAQIQFTHEILLTIMTYIFLILYSRLLALLSTANPPTSGNTSIYLQSWTKHLLHFQLLDKMS
jgi:hypothetical protein